MIQIIDSLGKSQNAGAVAGYAAGMVISIDRIAVPGENLDFPEICQVSCADSMVENDQPAAVRLTIAVKASPKFPVISVNIKGLCPDARKICRGEIIPGRISVISSQYGIKFFTDDSAEYHGLPP